MHRTAFREIGLEGILALRQAIPILFQSSTSAVTKCYSFFNTKHKCYYITKCHSYLIVRQLFQSAKQQTSDSFGAAICKKEKQKEKRFKSL